MNKKTIDRPASMGPAQHPLQRLPSPSISGISPLLHFAQLSAHIASFHYLTTTDNPVTYSFGWHFQYLTIFGLLFSTVTAALGSAADLLAPFNNTSSASSSSSSSSFSSGLASASSTLSSWQKSLLFGAAAPLEILIFGLYWSLRIVDKDLVVPPWAQMPLIPDLSFHLLPAACLIFDALMLSPPPKFTPLQGLLISSALALAYYPWVHLCYARNGYWPYTLFELVGPYGRIGLHVLSAVSMAANYSLLRLAYAVFNDGGRGTGKGGVPPDFSKETVIGRAEEEPEALRVLRESINGTLKRNKMGGQKGTKKSGVKG